MTTDVLNDIHQPFVSRFFQSAITANHLANTFVLLSSDASVALSFVQKIAQVLNCSSSNTPSEACGCCQNCLWILQNAHPSFMTLTNWSYDKKKATKNIAIDAFSEVLSDLSRHSGGAKRVVVLVGCTESDTAEVSQQLLWPTPIREQSAGKLMPAPLNTEIMSASLSNKLLKTLEEAPRDTYFFLITDSERKLFETILSRAQMIRFRPQKNPHSQGDKPANAQLEQLTEKLFQGQAMSMVQFRQSVLEIAEAEGVSSHQLLDAILLEAEALIPTKLQMGEDAFCHFRDQLQSIRQASEQIRQHVREDAVLEHLALNLT